jgi:uncharacterized protein (DUF2147 family)
MHPCIPKLACVALTVVSLSLHAETPTVQGYWREPLGAVLRIARCEDKLCIQIVAFSPGNHPHVDEHNPNASLRGRSLCGLRIGSGFLETDPRHARGGHLYDPRTGRTYSGSMTAEGDRLNLRGYFGIKLLGRTETWTRTGLSARPCQPQ